MDLAVYINELLGIEGEVNVPGIGRFAHTRINGYYNEKENKFYPPTHKINFDGETQADDRLARFISDKKNISLASATYFIDKYVNGLKQQIPVQEVDVAGLGRLYLNGSSIGFHEVDASKDNDPAFFGLKPINVEVLVEKPSAPYAARPVQVVEEETKAPSVADQVMTELVNDRIPPAPPKPAVIEQPPVIENPTVVEETEEPAEEEYIYDEPVRRNRSNIWIAILLILIIALLAILGLYKYKPEWFNLPKEKPQTFTAVDATEPADTSNADTTKKIVTKKDSLTKAQARVANNTNTVDTAAVLHYEILAGAFKSEEQANEILKRYQNIGLHPKILKRTKGNSYKITLGTYFDKQVAQKAADSILNATKMNKDDIYLQIYKPKQ